jgi:hypothetical protein
VCSSDLTALAVAVFWLVVAGILAMQFWPSVPHSAKGWVAFVVFGPPLCMLGEAFSEWLWSTRPARALAAHPSSCFRILVGVVVGATFFVGGVLLSIHFGWQ